MGRSRQKPAARAEQPCGLRLLSYAACARASARVSLNPCGPDGAYAPRGAVARLKYTARELDPGARAAALRAAAEVFKLCAEPGGDRGAREAAWACGVELSRCNREVNSVFIKQVVLELAWASKRGSGHACFDAAARALCAP